MNAILSNEYDTQTNRVGGFGADTTPRYTSGIDVSSCMRLEVLVPGCTAYPQGTDPKGWSHQVVWYGADDTNGFEPIPSVQERGYYGTRKVERRPSAPTVPVVHLKRVLALCGAKEEPVKSLQLYLAEMGKYTAEVTRTHSKVLVDEVKSVLVSVSNLTGRSGINKDKWEERLDDLQAFERNWDSYDAEPPSEQSLGNARAFMAFLRAISKEPVALNPSTVGGVGFTFRHGKRSVYIEFRNTGNAHAAFMGAGKPRVAKVIQSRDGFQSVMHQAETHLYEQDAAAARSDEASGSSRY